MGASILVVYVRDDAPNRAVGLILPRRKKEAGKYTVQVSINAVVVAKKSRCFHRQVVEKPRQYVSMKEFAYS
jgi:hypothetical protein